MNCKRLEITCCCLCMWVYIFALGGISLGLWLLMWYALDLFFIREKEITNLRFLFLYSRENKISKAYRYFRIIGGNKSTCRWLSIASQFNQRLTTLPGIYLPKSLFFKTLSYSEEKEASSVSLLQFSLIFHFPSLFLHF